MTTPTFNNGGKRGVINTRTAHPGDKSGLWSVDEIRNSKSSIPDPNFASCTFLAHFDQGPYIQAQNFGPNWGSAGNGLQPIAAQTVVASGSPPYLDNGQTKWGTTALFHCNATTQPDGTPSWLNFLLGDWQIEGWFYVATPISVINWIDLRPTAGNGWYPAIYSTGGATPKLKYFANSADRITGTTTITVGWHHFIAARSGGNVRLGMDGVQEGSTFADANSYTGSQSRVFMGASAFINGTGVSNFIDSVRVYKGYGGGITGATYTVPIARFPDFGP